MPLTPANSIPLPPVLPQATGLKRVLFVVGGFFFIGMAYLGAILPGLPTTPWVLLASYCFARSSPRLQRWLWYSPFFGVLIRDWYHHRGMRRSAKITAVCMIVVACTCSIVFANIPDWLRIVIGCCGLTGMSVVTFLVRTVR